MLVEFSVSNFRSILDRQTLSFVAGAGNELRRTHVIQSNIPATPDLLRSAVIYGPNAAGKSSIILALRFFRNFVLSSAQKSQQGDETGVTPFKLDDGDAATKPSEFEIIFVEDGVRYQYGVSLTHTAIHSEWLVSYPKGSPQAWFERDLKKTMRWKFGPSFKGQRKLWQDSTRDNALFLSTAVQLKSRQLQPLFEWFRNRLRVVTANIHPDFSIEECERDENVRSQIITFMRSADLGIDDVKITHSQFDESKLPNSMPEVVKKQILQDMANKDFPEVRLSHKTLSGKAVFLDMEVESNGTQQLFSLAGPLLDVLQNGMVLVVDELDTSLHPVLMRKLVEMFHNPATNKNNAQLVFTTHDTSILDREVFRRDQVWFVEKDRGLKTHLYALSDFSPRKDESFSRGYMQGRYGALPFIGELRI